MQSSLLQQRGCQALASRRPAAAPFKASRATVKVFAKKGKGKGALRQSAGVSGAPGVPGLGGAAQMVGGARPQTPEVDPENAEFVLFFRVKNYQAGKFYIEEGEWQTLSIMKGSQSANFLVKAMESEWGRKLYSRLVIQNIGRSLYQERDKIEQSLRQTPGMANVASKNLSYGFKIRDKSRPSEWKNPEGITVLPPESELLDTPLDSMRKFFSMDNLSKLFSQ